MREPSSLRGEELAPLQLTASHPGNLRLCLQDLFQWKRSRSPVKRSRGISLSSRIQRRRLAQTRKWWLCRTLWSTCATRRGMLTVSKPFERLLGIKGRYTLLCWLRRQTCQFSHTVGLTWWISYGSSTMVAGVCFILLRDRSRLIGLRSGLACALPALGRISWDTTCGP